MQSAAFVDSLQTLQQPIECVCMDLPFPAEPPIQKSDDPSLSSLAEFQGTEAQVISHAAGAEMLITHLAPISAHVVQSLPDLKFVAVSRGGPVNVDRQALAERNIRLVNTPGRNASAVAEFTIGALIAQSRNICLGHEQLKRGHWRGDLYRADVQRKELSHKRFHPLLGTIVH